MRTFFTIICLLALSFSACENQAEETPLICGVKDPLTELSWLKKEKDALLGGPEVNAIVLYSYDGQNVIEVQGSVFSSTNQHQYYCDGGKLNLDQPSAFQKYRTERKELKVLYGNKIWN